MATRNVEQESWIPDSESAVRFAIGSTVSPFWVILVRFLRKNVRSDADNHKHAAYHGKTYDMMGIGTRRKARDRDETFVGHETLPRR